jgi:hypothetical protein
MVVLVVEVELKLVVAVVVNGRETMIACTHSCVRHANWQYSQRTCNHWSRQCDALLGSRAKDGDDELRETRGYLADCVVRFKRVKKQVRLRSTVSCVRCVRMYMCVVVVVVVGEEEEGEGGIQNECVCVCVCVCVGGGGAGVTPETDETPTAVTTERRRNKPLPCVA